MRATKTTAIFLLLCTAYGSVVGLPANRGASRSKQTAGDSNRRDQYSYEIGRRLGEAFVRNCSIFIGTIYSMDNGPVIGETYDDRKIQSDAKVYLIVNEWLWNKQANDASELQLNHFPFSKSKPFEAVASPDGRDIAPRIGDRLLIVSYLDMSNNDVKTEINNYAMVLTDESLFQQVRDTVHKHTLYEKEPSQLTNDLSGLDKSDDLIFCGYLVSYLWRAAKPNNADNEAMALSKLLVNNRVPSLDWVKIRMILQRILLDSHFPLSEAPFHIIINNLVDASGSNNISLAKQTMPILLLLSDSEQLDVTPFLSPVRHRNLVANYRKLLSTGFIRGGHTKFESQLHLK